ncbi:hypothetical protein Cgig2_015760 [Carnegiea gigantea]|uniref:Uncharacterized protein n=1 Tax=Carnegiea gigantea TaxID=171969 RepID=A0A9Q1JH04_9CARY|nr:hypothetical protein Cgig2_015760 [Carnegiea gigantea]
MRGCKGKPTIEQWIAFWFQRPNKYHVSKKSDQGNQIPHPGILFSIINVGVRGGMILAKNFDTHESVSEASSSPGMVKFSSLGHAKSFQSASDSKRKRSDFFTRKFQRMKANLVAKLKIVCSEKPLEHFVLPMDDGSSCIKIPGIDVVVPATPVPAIPIKSVAPLPQDKLPIKVREPSIKKVTKLPPEGAENIMHILNAEPNPTECMVSRTPFDQPPSPKGDFDSLYATILQRGVDVKGLVKQACKLDGAFHWLNTEGTHYKAKTAELKQVELKREELLKELRLLEDQKKDLSSQVAVSEHLLQEAKQEVIDLQGQIDILNATEVIDAATKASLEKAEAYIKESFEDLKNFQWNP